jgi:hypothetical protein
VIIVTSLLLFALSVPLAAQTQEAPGRIVGRVTTADTNFPLDNALVILIRLPVAEGPQRPYATALADADGRFALERVAAGMYYVDAQRIGYAPLDQPASNARTIVEIAAGSVIDLAIGLRKGGAINGRVLDRVGEPVAGIRVMAFQLAPPEPPATTPRALPASTRPVETNDLGEYRLAGLAPGAYFVGAVPRAAVPLNAVGALPPSGRARITTATTFYPGTANLRAAAPILVNGAGDDVRDIVFTMQPVPAFHISGIVVDDHGAAVPHAIVVLIPDLNSGVAPGPPNAVETGADGQFTLGEVTAGRYRLHGSIPGVVSNPQAPDVSPMDIVISDGDIVGVRVVAVRRE